MAVRETLRRGVGPAAAVLTVFGVIAAAAGIASDVTSERVLARPGAGRPGGSYARDPIGTLAPINAQFVARRVGAVARPRAKPARIAPLAPRKTTVAPSAPREDRVIRGEPGVFRNLAPGGWVLSVGMQATPTAPRAGDEVRYRMTIRNTGTDEFRSRPFILEWETPSGTVGRNALDQCGLLPLPLLPGICAGQRVFVTPAITAANSESLNSAGLVVIGVGEEWTHDWYVQTLPGTASGTTLENQARLTVNVNGDDLTTTSDVVVVTVG